MIRNEMSATKEINEMKNRVAFACPAHSARENLHNDRTEVFTLCRVTARQQWES